MIRQPKPIQPKEAAWLDFMEQALTLDFAQCGLDGLLPLLANAMEVDDQDIAIADHDPVYWRILQAVLAEKRASGIAINGPLQEWAFDVAEGKRTQPTRSQGQDRNLGRDMLIACTVAFIRDLGRPVATSDKGEGGSVCHIVSERTKNAAKRTSTKSAAKREGLSYETIRRIWRQYGSHFPPKVTQTKKG